eukprot:TRINITY_DN94_c0_g1_i12.p1 TRINITY_DN94_c0_g1~~TRINITY_DN94_c0_g1_i12.p1  ORF type:complete len:199 (-),score=42.62 TRINITY_DN94_c0_g1_i12:925-1521(-)
MLWSLFLPPSATLRANRDAAILFRHCPEITASLKGIMIRVGNFEILRILEEPFFKGNLKLQFHEDDVMADGEADFHFLQIEAKLHLVLAAPPKYSEIDCKGSIVLVGHTLCQFQVEIDRMGFLVDFKFDLWLLKIDAYLRVNEMPEFRGRIYAGVDEMKENLEAVSQNTAKTSLEAFSVFINKALEAMSWIWSLKEEI